MSSQNPGCLGFLFGVRQKQNSKNENLFPYIAKPYVFSNAEASFYHFLKQMFGESVIIFPHVALRDLVGLQKGLDNSARTTYFNKINKKTSGFCIS